MKPMKRNHGQDQFGRSGSVFPIRLLALATFAVIVGSVWPISARSLDPASDTILSDGPIRPSTRVIQPILSDGPIRPCRSFTTLSRRDREARG